MTTLGETQTPRISIVTVTLNSQDFVAETFESVLKQSYENLEYIVVDGGSTDSTLQIIKENENRITRWISEPDKGIADAFNKGMSMATGEYILFLNSDDALANSHILSEVAANIVENNRPTLIYGDYQVVGRLGGAFLYTGSVVYNESRLCFGQVLPHPCLFTNREYFQRYGLFDTQFRIAMDYEWLLRGIRQERVIHIPLVTTIIRDGGVSTRNEKMVVSEIIKAQVKNGYLKSRYTAGSLYTYFTMRAFARRVLQQIGLHQMIKGMKRKK